MMFRGSITALVTPFAGGRVDENAYQRLIEWQIEQGTHGLVPVGTTGESPTLTHEEHRRVVELCVQTVRGRVPVIAGAGSNSTEEALSLMRFAKSVGAQAGLVVTPYYNKPNQEGVYRHFKRLNDEVQLPIIVYNNPGRSVVDISPDTMIRLAALPNIVGVKDANPDMGRLALIWQGTGDAFIQLSGDDPSAVGFNAQGGHGCISVTANVAPGLCRELQMACTRGEFAAARDINRRLAPLHKALFCEPSPAPTKYALSLLGLCGEEVRSPLFTLTDEGKAQVRAAMEVAGLLNAAAA